MIVTVNPNHTDHALGEIERCVAAGAIGVKLLASRRADDPLLDPIAELAASMGCPCFTTSGSIVGASGRRRRSPMARISRASPGRHPKPHASFSRTSAAAATTAHVPGVVEDSRTCHPDLSGSGVDRGMLDDAIGALGSSRLLWGSDLTMCTGLAKLRALESSV